jgi:uncharacterized protein
MRVLVSGAGGLIGKAVCARLRARGHEVRALVRDPRRARPGDLVWQPHLPMEAASLADFDAIVHLAGKPVATRWNDCVKREIRDSRVDGTANLARAAAQAFPASGRPQALICASAMGYYGNRGDEELTEESRPGLGFLADVCRLWESAAQPAAAAGVRVAKLRTGLVLSPAGGALATMLPGFRMGVAGALGSGRQWCSWVSLEDAARAYVFVVENPQVHGALNLCSPQPVTNAEFARTLGHVLHRPARLDVPAWLLRITAGEVADEMLLASQRMAPRRLLEAGFEFEDAELEATLRKLLSRREQHAA